MNYIIDTKHFNFFSKNRLPPPVTGVIKQNNLKTKIKTPYRYDFVTCASRRWVSALANPFPAAMAGLLQCIRVASPDINKCRNKINTCTG